MRRFLSWFLPALIVALVVAILAGVVIAVAHLATAFAFGSGLVIIFALGGYSASKLGSGPGSPALVGQAEPEPQPSPLAGAW